MLISALNHKNLRFKVWKIDVDSKILINSNQYCLIWIIICHGLLLDSLSCDSVLYVFEVVFEQKSSVFTGKIRTLITHVPFSWYFRTLRRNSRRILSLVFLNRAFPPFFFCICSKLSSSFCSFFDRYNPLNGKF